MLRITCGSFLANFRSFGLIFGLTTRFPFSDWRHVFNFRTDELSDRRDVFKIRTEEPFFKFGVMNLRTNEPPDWWAVLDIRTDELIFTFGLTRCFVFSDWRTLFHFRTDDSSDWKDVFNFRTDDTYFRTDDTFFIFGLTR